MGSIFITALVGLTSFTALSGSFDMNEAFTDQEKLKMCGGKFRPSHSSVFGKVSNSGQDYVMASLASKVDQIQTISYSDKSQIASIYMKAKSDRQFTRKSKGQYDQLGGHYQKRGSVGVQVYNHTSQGLNDAYEIIASNANEQVQEILASKHHLKIFNKVRRVPYNNLDVLMMCDYYWK